MTDAILGQVIAERRKALGLSQTDLAKRLNSKDKRASDQVSKWERGVRNPQAETLQRIAETLGTTEVALRAEVARRNPGSADPLAEQVRILTERVEQLERKVNDKSPANRS